MHASQLGFCPEINGTLLLLHSPTNYYELLKILMHAPKSEQYPISSYYFNYIRAGSEFTLSNILEYLKDVPPKKYMELALRLEVSKNTVEKFEMEHPRDYDRVLLEIVNFWMHNCTHPSWHTLECALQNLEY